MLEHSDWLDVGFGGTTLIDASRADSIFSHQGPYGLAVDASIVLPVFIEPFNRYFLSDTKKQPPMTALPDPFGEKSRKRIYKPLSI